MKSISCPHCHVPMQFSAHQRIQLGETGWFLGDLPNLLAGSLAVDIYMCPACRKLEFFASDGEDEGDEGLPQKTCPACGEVHDFDYPRCPKCKYDYYAK